MPEDGIKMIMNEDGVFEKYNDEYDLTIHFESQEEQDVFIKNAQTAVTREKIEQIKEDALHDIYMAGVNMTGEYHGCWVRFKDIENIVNEHFSGGLDKNSQKLELQEQEPKPMVEIDLYSVIKQKYIERKVLDKIREQIKSYLRGVEITLEVLVENDPLRPKMEGAKDTLEECLELIDKAETENP